LDAYNTTLEKTLEVSHADGELQKKSSDLIMDFKVYFILQQQVFSTLSLLMRITMRFEVTTKYVKGQSLSA